MYTQCANCKTLFRISEDQLQLVSGKVRCGFCYGTFNAYDALYDDLPDDSTDPSDEWEDEEEEPAVAYATQKESTTEEFSAPSLPQDLAQEYAGEGVRVNARHINVPTTIPPPPPRPLPAVNRLNTPSLRSAPSVAPKPRATPPPKAAPPPIPPRPQAPTQPAKPTAKPAAAPAFGAAPTYPGVDAPPMPRDDPSGRLPNLFDAIDLAGRELQQVSRLDLDRRRGYGNHGELLASIGWGLATLILISAILLQVAYFARDDLSRHAQLRPLLERMCDIANCEIALMRNTGQIKLVSRDIRVHPKITDALEVRATFVNDARFTQPYPILRLELTDASGNRIATRQFEPGEYLADKTNIKAGIAPQQQVDVKLEILDSEHNAHGFEFSFF